MNINIVKNSFTLSRLHFWFMVAVAFLFALGFSMSGLSTNGVSSGYRYSFVEFFILFLYLFGVEAPFRYIYYPLWGHHVGEIHSAWFSWIVPNASGWIIIILGDLLTAYILASMIKLIFHRKAKTNG